MGVSFLRAELSFLFSLNSIGDRGAQKARSEESDHVGMSQNSDVAPPKNRGVSFGLPLNIARRLLSKTSPMLALFQVGSAPSLVGQARNGLAAPEPSWQ